MTLKATLYVALATILRSTTATPAIIPNIVGGEPAKEGKFPYIVALAQPDWLLCGGTLLNANKSLPQLIAPMTALTRPQFEQDHWYVLNHDLGEKECNQTGVSLTEYH